MNFPTAKEESGQVQVLSGHLVNWNKNEKFDLTSYNSFLQKKILSITLRQVTANKLSLVQIGKVNSGGLQTSFIALG